LFNKFFAFPCIYPKIIKGVECIYQLSSFITKKEVIILALDLRGYIRAQCDNNIDPNIVRHNLISAGWPQLQVDREITSIYARRDLHVVKGNTHLLRGLVVVVAVLLGVMVFIYVALIDGVSAPEPNVNNNNNNNNNANNNVDNNIGTSGSNQGSNQDAIQLNSDESKASNCFALSDSVQKDACYRELVQTGFDCEVLSDFEESTFCFRALESTLIN
jgi:hypothetical protein